MVFGGGVGYDVGLEPGGVASGGDVGEAEHDGALLVAHLHTH